LLCLGMFTSFCLVPHGLCRPGLRHRPRRAPTRPWFDGGGKGVKPGRVRTPLEPTVQATRRRAPTRCPEAPEHRCAEGSKARRQLREVLAAGQSLCNDGPMAKTVIVKLTDDLDGGDADETVTFALDGRSYEIDVSSANAARLRDALKPFVAKARPSAGRTGARGARQTRSDSAETTMYSQLKEDEKARFRSWANMATARRISDARVKSWIAAGKP
jgi:hypothetical protein